jgi:hypothetical protein
MDCRIIIKNKKMKKYITTVSSIKVLVLSFLITLSTPVSAQADLPDAPDDTVAASIDGYIWVMALIGLTFVFLKMRNYIKQTNIL